MRTLHAAALACSMAASISAQPGIAQNGVINSASRIPTTLAGGAIAKGALFTIRGVKFGSTSATTAVIKSGNVTTPVKIIAATKTFVEALMPASAPLGRSSLIVSVDGKPSRPFALEIVASNPGIFSRDGTGFGPGRIQNIIAGGSRVENADSHAAAPGSRIAIAATGLGDVKSIGVLIGDKNATGRVGPSHSRPARPGEAEVVVEIPKDAIAGCRVPLALMAGPARASNFVTMAVGPRNGACDPGPLPQIANEKVGVALFTHARMRAIREKVPEAVRDHVKISFLNTASYAPNTPLRLLPPAGACATYTGGYETEPEASSFSMGTFTPVGEIEGRELDAGASLRLQAGNQTRLIQLVPPGYYREAAVRNQLLFLNPGPLRLIGTGGKQVGPFTADLTIPAGFAWTDREQTKVIDRSRGVTVHWKAASPDQVMFVMAGNVDQITTALGVCICAMKASAGQFTIPPAMLANVPASQDMAGVPYDEMMVGAIGVKPGPAVRGLNRTVLITLFSDGRYVEYR